MRLDHDPVDEDTTLVLATWRYQGTGWLTDADAALATLAADAARKRQTRRHLPALTPTSHAFLDN